MAATAPSGRDRTPPNPSPRLEDQAATAALRVTKAPSKPKHPLLDESGKLSSAGAATSFKYAQPEDLPSFPSPGLQLASASAAASLADANKRTVELWKPGALPGAEKAAFIAKDYEPEPLWQPDLSTAGSKAALLASDKTSSPTIWKPGHLDDGHSAAEQAARKPSPQYVDHRAVPSDAGRKALLAATGAMASSRRRADSAPTAPMKSPEVASQAQWALKAATQSQRGQRSTLSPGNDSPAMNASRVQNIAQNNMSRQMYTSHPPVSIEVEERNRQDTLRASAVAMAQKMYAIQQKAIDEAKSDISRSDSHYAARNVHKRQTSEVSSTTTSETPAAPLYSSNLQEAAQKLAQERLDKMRDERGEYMKYYGQKPTSTRSRLSMQSKLRRRASSDGAVENLDEEQSRKIRSQMSIFQSNLAAVDEKKRQEDRSSLLAAAQRNVRASMNSLDQEVFLETGKSSPAQREEWAAQARKKATADSEARMQNFGKVHIGSGKYIDQADVDATAKSRLQPTLDEINEKVDAKRAHEAEIRLEQEERQRKAGTEKKRATDLKADEKRAKDEEKRDDKNKKAQEKQAQKEELALLMEREKLAKDESKLKAKIEKEQTKAEEEPKEKTKHRLVGLISPLSIGGKGSKGGETSSKVLVDRPKSAESQISTHEAKARSEKSSDSLPDSSEERERPASDKSVEAEAVKSPSSPSGGRSKVKSWLTGRFHRSNKAARDGDEAALVNPDVVGQKKTTEPSPPAREPAATAGEDSERDVALVGVSVTTKITKKVVDTDPASVSPLKPGQATKTSDDASISSLSASETDQPTKRARPRSDHRGLKDRLLAKMNTKTSDRASDEFEEARDTFDEVLAPPPKMTSVVSRKPSGSPVRDSRFSEIL